MLCIAPRHDLLFNKACDVGWSWVKLVVNKYKIRARPRLASCR